MAETSIIALLSSGLVGALAAGAINHWFRRRETKLDRLKQEKRAAYIYVTKLARIPAAVDILKAQVAPYKDAVNGFVKSLKDKHKVEFTLDELACVAIDEYTKDEKREPLAPEVRTQLDVFADTLKNVETFLAFRLTTEQLAMMPRSIAVHYSQFETALEGFFVGADFIRRCLRREVSTNAYTLFGCWIAAKRLHVTANDLIDALRKFGEIADDEYREAFMAASLAYRLVNAETTAATARLGKIAEIVRGEIASHKAAGGKEAKP